jgi:holo-[acyl-carrier protein] synthase
VTSSGALRVGIDLVQVSRIADSLERFGERFLRRVFTDDEIAYAKSAPALTAERLAARFAAKEATMKALEIGDAAISWRDIEVSRAPSGACELTLRGAAGQAAARCGAESLALSLSHEGDYAAAVVVTRMRGTRDP